MKNFFKELGYLVISLLMGFILSFLFFADLGIAEHLIVYLIAGIILGIYIRLFPRILKLLGEMVSEIGG